MSVGKWAANNCNLLSDLGVHNSELKGSLFEDEETVSTLGLRWSASEDAFCFKISQAQAPPEYHKTFYFVGDCTVVRPCRLVVACHNSCENNIAKPLDAREKLGRFTRAYPPWNF